MHIRIIGMGAIGSRLALRALQTGWNVLGIDNSQTRIKELGAGAGDAVAKAIYSYIDKTLELSTTTSSGSYHATFVCVSSWHPEDGLNSKSVLNALSSLGQHISPNEVVIIESSVPPGTTQGLARSVLEQQSGMTAGVDFDLAFSPERVDLNIAESVAACRVVGGINEESGRRAVQIYQSLGIETLQADNATTAEACKILENCFRLVNIAFANEAAEVFRSLGVDPKSIVEAAATKPFGFLAFWPSAGAGGHCIPAAALAFANLAREVGVDTPVTSIAIQANQTSPHRIERELLNKGISAGAHILVLGSAYKGGTRNSWESPGLRLAEHLTRSGFHVTVCDVAENCAAGILSSEEVKGRTFVATCVTAWQDDFEQLIPHVQLGIVFDYTGSASPLRAIGGQSMTPVNSTLEQELGFVFVD